MTTKTRKIRAEELSADLQKGFNLKPKQLIKITVEIMENEERRLGKDLIEGLREISESKKKGIKRPSARELLNSL